MGAAAEHHFSLPFAAPFGVPRTVCPACGERMVPGRTVEYQVPEYPAGNPADAARQVLWHSACVVLAGRDPVECSECGEGHATDGACLL